MTSCDVHVRNAGFVFALCLDSTCSLFGQYLFKRVSDIKQREDKIRRKQQEDKARQEELKKGE